MFFFINRVLKNERLLIMPGIFYLLTVLAKINNVNVGSDVLSVSLFSASILLLMLACAFSIVNHAHKISEILGEPYGTIVLTMAVTGIEIAIILATVISSGSGLGILRNTAFAIIMLSVNGFAGISLLIGGLKYNRQRYNLEGANTYVAILGVLMTICLILPNYTVASEAGTFNDAQVWVVSGICIISYLALLFKQTVTHPDFFIDAKTEESKGLLVVRESKRVFYHIMMTTVGLAIMILLSEDLAIYLEKLIEITHLPSKLAGLIIAALVLAPEGVSAVIAAHENKLQKSINLCLGSAVATIALTVPIVLLFNSLFLDAPIFLGLSRTEELLAILTLFTSSVTFSAKQTSASYGMLLIGIFAVYTMTIFDLPVL